jgi:hypothetical protein
MRLNFNQSFDKQKVCNDAGERIPPTQRQIRHSSTTVSELRQADAPSSYYPWLGRASGLERVQMRRVRSVGDRIC